MADYTAFQAPPCYIMLKPAGPLCNLNCKYCYYTEKTALFKKSITAADRPMTLSDELLEKFTREYIEMQPANNVLFTWHGGEPLLLPISYYKRALRLQRKYAHGKQIDNTLQTNGTLITDEWAEFFKRNNFLVGVSIDGPQAMHDAYRKSRGGRSSWQQVMRGIEILNRHGVEWNALAVVNDLTAKDPQAFYQFFRSINCKFIQFTPVVERQEQHTDGRHLAQPLSRIPSVSDVMPFSVTPRAWGNFLCSIFDQWVRHDVGDTFIQIFDATLANWVGVAPGICTLSPTCGHALAMEHNGDVYACDHYVFPEFRRGNLHTHSLQSMAHSPLQKQFGQHKRDGLPRQCQECTWQFACHGECPRLRFIKDRYGNDGLNYLCQGYQQFFQHVAPYMDYMKTQLQQQQSPANVMQHIDEIESQR